jgi:SPP1 family predicted phage head-tail adaptor
VRYGRLDRKITIQRKTSTLADDGSEVEAWADLVASRWASVNPVSGDERFSVPQIGASQQTEFLIRWSSTVEGLTPKDRIIYPVTPVTSPETPTPDTSIYDIAAVHEVGRRQALRLIATRRTDT